MQISCCRPDFNDIVLPGRNQGYIESTSRSLRYLNNGPIGKESRASKTVLNLRHPGYVKAARQPAQALLIMLPIRSKELPRSVCAVAFANLTPVLPIKYLPSKCQTVYAWNPAI